jgi:hypothetical protein
MSPTDTIDHADWKALVERREKAYVTRHCTCCAASEKVGPDGLKGRLVPAGYRWTVREVNGLAVEELLCERCCAYWRAGVAEGRALVPLRIESL